MRLGIICLLMVSFSGCNPAKKSVVTEEKKEESQKEKKVETISKKAVFETNKGTFEVELYADRAPKTVENFVGLATGTKEWTDPKTGKKVTNKSLYEGTKFHRVIKDFMIQGGDPLGMGTGGPGYNFADEFNDNDKFDSEGILAMANAGPNTNGSQFFITVAKTPHLNKRHTIFGKIIKGYEVVKGISVAETDAMDRPKSEIVINKITIQ